MRLPLNEGFVVWACSNGLERDLVRSVMKEIDRQRAGVDQDKFFETLSTEPASAKGYWTRGVAVNGRRVKDPKALVKFLRLLRPTIEIDVRTEPWNRWRAGARVVVVVGQRDVSIPEVSTTVKQRAIGARDSEAFAQLADTLHRDLGLDCQIELTHLPSRMPPEAAALALQGWREADDVGMICVLGSPVVNPVANEVARQILSPGVGLGPEESPVKFRWAYSVGANNFLADTQIPQRRSTWRPEDEGIGFPGIARTAYPRVGDDLVRKQFTGGKDLAGRRFKDAGLFMMDCRNRPILVLCAGHGGAGTLGCAEQLRDRNLVDELLEASRTEKGSRDRIVAVVEVNRKRPPQARRSFNVDDLQVVSSPMVWASVDVPGRTWR